MMKMLLTAAVMSVLVLGSAGCSGSGPSAATLQPTVTAPSPSGPESGHNRALAAAEAAHVLATIPIPPGAKVDSSSHHGGQLGHLGCQCGAVDPSLTETRWWTVPLSYSDLVHWYGTHSPANLGSARYPDGSLSPQAVLYWEIQVTSTAYSTPTAQVSYVRTGPKVTAIRTDATLAARYDRTALTLVPHDVTRIEITKTALGGPAHRTSAIVTTPALLTRVISSFNSLSGAFADTLPVGCGSPAGDAYVYAITFYWSGHTLAVDPGEPLCGVGMGLTLDGVKLTQTLQDDSTLDAALEAAF